MSKKKRVDPQVKQKKTKIITTPSIDYRIQEKNA